MKGHRPNSDSQKPSLPPGGEGLGRVTGRVGVALASFIQDVKSYENVKP